MLCDGVFLVVLVYCRFTSIRGGKPIGMVSCPSPRSCKTVLGDRAVFPARGWSCLPCCASKLVTTWPLSNTAPQILPGSSSTAWLTVMVGVMAFGSWACYYILEMKLWCTKNSFTRPSGLSWCYVTSETVQNRVCDLPSCIGSWDQYEVTTSSCHVRHNCFS